MRSICVVRHGVPLAVVVADPTHTSATVYLNKSRYEDVFPLLVAGQLPDYYAYLAQRSSGFDVALRVSEMYLVAWYHAGLLMRNYLGTHFWIELPKVAQNRVRLVELSDFSRVWKECWSAKQVLIANEDALAEMLESDDFGGVIHLFRMKKPNIPPEFVVAFASLMYRLFDGLEIRIG